MAYFSETKTAHIDGVVVEVEAKVGWSGSSEFSLIVAGQRLDRTKGSSGLAGTAGKATLHGRLPDGRSILVRTIPSTAGSWMSGSVLSGMGYEAEIDGRTLVLGDDRQPPAYETQRATHEAIAPERGAHGALQQLEAMRADGLVTDDEYQTKRAEILGRL